MNVSPLDDADDNKALLVNALEKSLATVIDDPRLGTMHGHNNHDNQQ